MPDPVQSVDLHIHSHFSDAPHNSLRAITQACLTQGIGACICDHNEIRGSIRLYEEGQVATVPSIEVGSRSRVEFLVYFRDPAALEEYFRTCVEPHNRRNFYSRLAREFEPLVREAKERGAVVTLPHPFAPGWKNLGARVNAENLRRLLAPDVLRLIDFIEVINGHLSEKRNFRAYQFAEQHRKAFVVGSDAHAPQEIGKVYVAFEEPIAADEIVQTLTRRNRLLVKIPFSPWRFVRTAQRVVPRHVLLYLLPAKQRVWMNAGGRAHGRK